MPGHSIIRSTPFILRGDQSGLQQVVDEVFLDLGGEGDTKFLSVGCYEQAVRDCVVMGDNCFLLKIRADLRGLILAELGKNHSVYRVYRYQDRPETRLLLAPKLEVQFKSETPAEERRRCLSRYFSNVSNESDPSDGVYSLSEELSGHPLSACERLKTEAAIADAALLAFTFSSRLIQVS